MGIARQRGPMGTASPGLATRWWRNQHRAAGNATQQESSLPRNMDREVQHDYEENMDVFGDRMGGADELARARNHEVRHAAGRRGFRLHRWAWGPTGMLFLLITPSVPCSTRLEMSGLGSAED